MAVNWEEINMEIKAGGGWHVASRVAMVSVTHCLNCIFVFGTI